MAPCFPFREQCVPVCMGQCVPCCQSRRCWHRLWWRRVESPRDPRTCASVFWPPLRPNSGSFKNTNERDGLWFRLSSANKWVNTHNNSCLWLNYPCRPFIMCVCGLTGVTTAHKWVNSWTFHINTRSADLCVCVKSAHAYLNCLSPIKDCVLHSAAVFKRRYPQGKSLCTLMMGLK